MCILTYRQVCKMRISKDINCDFCEDYFLKGKERMEMRKQFNRAFPIFFLCTLSMTFIFVAFLDDSNDYLK